MQTLTYQKGTLFNVSDFLDKKGNVMPKGTFKNGNGVRKGYFNKDEIWFEENYRNGLLSGTTRYYYPGPDKILASEQNYKEGLLEGFTKRYYDFGPLQSQAIFKAGKLTGKYVEYYEEEGKLKIEGWYKNGLEDSTWAEFYEEGE